MIRVSILILILSIFISCSKTISNENKLNNNDLITNSTESPPTPLPTATPLPTPTSEKIEVLNLNEKTTKLNITFENNAIRNYTQFIVPERKILSELVLEKYKGEDKIAFYGVYKTNKLWEPTEDIVPLLSAWGHIDSEKLIGKNILSYSDNLELSIDQRENYGYVELGAGMYIILVQNGNTINAEYEFSFILK